MTSQVQPYSLSFWACGSPTNELLYTHKAQAQILCISGDEFKFYYYATKMCIALPPPATKTCESLSFFKIGTVCSWT